VLQLSVNVSLKSRNGYLQDSDQEFPLPAMPALTRPANAAKAQ
jgi:hypothetical protein